MRSDVAWNPDLWKAAGGDVPPDWDLVPFGELLQSPKSITVGVMYPGEHTEGGAPLIRVGDVGGGGTIQATSMCIAPAVHHEYRRTELSGNELLITLVGTPGVCILAQPRMNGWNVARALAVARMKSPALRSYIKAVLESSVMRNIILSMLNTTVQPTLNLKEIKILPVPMPRQAEVALALGDVAELFNQRIALLQQANTTLEAVAQALFKSWFVDFDPVHAKAEGREPEAMDAATAALFPTEFEESELGLVPKGWHVGRVDEVSHLNATSWSSKRHPDTVSYIDLSGVHENRIAAVDELPFSDAPSRARRSLQDGDTIIGTVRPGNRAFAYIHRPAINLTGSTGFAVLSPKDGTWAPFVYLAATRNDSIERLANLADGGAYPAVRPDVVSATPATIPPSEIMAAFSVITSPILCKIGENRDAEASLVELRDTLLPCLISGRLRLPDAEREIEAVV